jgi:hypothetical protein
MKLSNIANVIDAEYDSKRLLEIGITHVRLDTLEIIDNYSLPVFLVPSDISWNGNLPIPEVSQEIQDLTGWNNKSLKRSGYKTNHIHRLLADKHGFNNRLLITDTSNELEGIRKWINIEPSPNTLNVSILFSLLTQEQTNLGLDKMLEYFNMEFEGRRHRADSDSYNIARLFVAIMEKMRYVGC